MIFMKCPTTEKLATLRSAAEQNGWAAGEIAVDMLRTAEVDAGSKPEIMTAIIEALPAIAVSDSRTAVTLARDMLTTAGRDAGLISTVVTGVIKALPTIAEHREAAFPSIRHLADEMLDKTQGNADLTTTIVTAFAQALPAIASRNGSGASDIACRLLGASKGNSTLTSMVAAEVIKVPPLIAVYNSQQTERFAGTLLAQVDGDADLRSTLITGFAEALPAIAPLKSWLYTEHAQERIRWAEGKPNLVSAILAEAAEAQPLIANPDYHGEPTSGLVGALFAAAKGDVGLVSSIFTEAAKVPTTLAEQYSWAAVRFVGKMCSAAGMDTARDIICREFMLTHHYNSKDERILILLGNTFEESRGYVGHSCGNLAELWRALNPARRYNRCYYEETFFRASEAINRRAQLPTFSAACAS